MHVKTLLKIFVILLLTSIPRLAWGQDPYRDAECWVINGIGAAPTNNTLDLDLPPVRATPEGILFPPDTARYTLWRLHCLQAWPAMAQAKLDEQGSVDAFKMRRERELNGKLRNEIVPPPRDGFSLTTIIAVGAVSLAAGAIAAALVVH